MTASAISSIAELEIDSLTPSNIYSRRNFIVTSIGAGFALAVQPVVAQTVITTPADGLIAGEIKVPAQGGEMVAYRAQPSDGKHLPVVLVVQEIFGVHEYIRDTCRRLAKLGYLAIAPELFARQGDPRQYSAIPDIMSNIVTKIPDSQVMGDLDACVAWARGNGGDPSRLAITGFCWGGRITWLYSSHNPQVKAGVAWYGRLVSPPSANNPKHPVDIAGDLKAPVLGLYGGADQGIPPETVEKMRTELAKGSPAARTSEIKVYDGAPHAFHADYRPSYRKPEAEDGWQRMRDWFKRHGV